jgi:flagellin-like hook-associated protein FlgL
MSSIPSNLARVSNSLISQIQLSSLNRTSRDLLDLQVRLSTGREVMRPSDDAVAASTISVLDDLIERRTQRLRNLTHAESVLNNADAAIADASALLLEAKGLGLSQIGIGSDAETRKNQAQVVDSILAEMISIANRQINGIHFFGGDATATPPIQDLSGGLQYTGAGDGLTTDLGLLKTVPITMSADVVFGALSSRVEGDRDLDPDMTASTRLADVNGARGLGVALGAINVNVAGTPLTVDLSGAHTIGDVIGTLQTAIQTIDAAATVSIDPATGDRLLVNPSAGNITISDLTTDATAADLGLSTTFPVGGAAGSDLDPKVTPLTPLALLNGLTIPLGTIRIANAGQSRDVDLSGAQTVEDLINLIKSEAIGVRVEIAPGGDRLNFVNELSGGAMSVAEVGGGTTATQLGVRSFTGTTLLADFNNGLGVRVVDGSIDPLTGLPDPAADLDVRMILKNGVAFDVDLASEQTVQEVIAAINAAAAGAGVPVPASFEAALAADGNGLEFTDNTAGLPGAEFSIIALNGSYAAEDLGILGSTAGATFTGEDRATVAVDSVFSHLIALRDALLANDELGIELATAAFEQDISRAVEARALVGVRSQRVADAQRREEDLMIQDRALKSEMQDLDFTEASIRFALLQQQLQAGLATAARATSLSLLDFLG